MLGKLFAAFEHYIDGLDECRAAYRDAVTWKRKYPDLHRRIGRIYNQTVKEVAYYYRAIKRAVRDSRATYRTNPSVTSIEYLERTFILLRDAAKKESAEARRFYIGKQLYEAERSAKLAQNIAKLTIDAARTLAAELKVKKLWSKALVKELGLKRWLR